MGLEDGHGFFLRAFKIKVQTKLEPLRIKHIGPYFLYFHYADTIADYVSWDNVLWLATCLFVPKHDFNYIDT